MKYLNPRYLATKVLPRFLALFSSLGHGVSALHITGSQSTHLGAPLPAAMGSSLPYIDNSNRIDDGGNNHQHRVKKSHRVKKNTSLIYLLELVSENNWKEIIESMKRMEDKGPDVRRLINEVIIFEAVKQGRLEEVRYFMEKVFINPNVKDEDDVHLLSYAVKQGNMEIIKLLLENGADPNVSRSEYGYNNTPLLSYVAANSDVGMVKLLLEHGANVNAKDADGRNALWYAKKSPNKDEIIALLKSHKISSDGKNKHRLLEGCMEKISPCIVDLARNGKWEEVMELINDFEHKGYDISSPGNGGIYIIYTAVEQNKFDEVQFLLNKKVDPNVIWAHLPLLLVAIECEKSNVKMVELLLKYGADPNVRGAAFMGNVPLLSSAVQKGNLQIIELLLEHGADPKAKDNRGRDVFWYAAESSNHEIIVSLEKSKGLLQKTDDSQSVLTNAIINSDIDTSMSTTDVLQTNLADVVTVPGINVSRSLDV